MAATIAIALLGTASLALAQLGEHDGLASVGIAGVALVGLLVLARRHGLHLVRGTPELLLVGAVALVSLVMSVPGFPYAYADKDPGIYVNHALAIARDGDVQIDDPVLEANLPGVLAAPGARFPGVWTEGEPDSVTSQFFHYFSSLGATAVDLSDERAMFHLNAFLATLSAVVLALAARRAFGMPAGAITGTLLAVSLPQVWQAKYPSTEIVAQLLLGGALLALAIAADRRDRTMAFVGGLLVGIGFLARPDGLLLVALAIGALGACLALGPLDRTVRWGAAGLALTLPYALFNAYDLREHYTLSNEVPGVGLVGGMAVGGLVAARLARPVGPAIARWLGDPVRQRWLGTTLAAAFAGALVVFANRERLFGEAYTDLLGADPVRSYDEINLRRLGFYLSRLIWPIAVLGLAVVGRQRWRLARWIVVVPGLAMVPLYLWEAQVSPRMMWWVRRYVPGVVPFLLLLVGIALGWCVAQRRLLLRVAGAAAVVVLLALYLDRSLPIRDHREMGGSYEAAEAVAATAGGETGLFLWQRPVANDIYSPLRNMPAVVWLAFDQRSALLPGEPTQADVDAYDDRFPDHDIFVVSGPEGLPGDLDPSAFTEVAEVERVLTIWEEDVLARPQQSTSIGVDLRVWRLDGR